MGGTDSFLTWEERLACPWDVCLNYIIINFPGQTVLLSSQNHHAWLPQDTLLYLKSCDLPDSPNLLLFRGCRAWQILELVVRTPFVPSLKESDSKSHPFYLLASPQLHRFFLYLHYPCHQLSHHYLDRPIALLFGILASTLAPSWWFLQVKTGEPFISHGCHVANPNLPRTSQHI